MSDLRERLAQIEGFAQLLACDELPPEDVPHAAEKCRACRVRLSLEALRLSLSAPVSLETTNEEKDQGSCPSAQSPVIAHVERSATDAPVGEYDLRYEAQRIIEAIEPCAGATMTLMCALAEAHEAGRRGLPLRWWR